MTAKQIHEKTGDTVLGALLFKFFNLAGEERMPKTPRLTTELDRLTESIRSRCRQLWEIYP